MTIQVNLGDEQTARLDRFAQATQKSRVEATAQLIEEGLRHAEFPAIEFRDSAAGRQAYLVGSRLAVWHVVMVAQGFDRDARATAAHLQADPESIAEVLRYASVFSAEIEHAIAENRDATPDSIRTSLPSDAWVDIP